MRYTIVSDLPGRLRLRCGSLVMDEAEARGVAQALMSVEGVRVAEVHPANGSVLVAFVPASRDAVLLAVRSLDVLALPTAEPGLDEASGAIEVRAENNRFTMEVMRLVGAHVLRRLLLPAPLRAAWVVVRAIGFVARGLACLVRGELTVEVLDATAITASILRGSFDEAGTIIFFLQLSAAMERHVQSRSHLALRGNMITRAETVWAVVDGQDVRIPIDEVTRGQVLHLGRGSVLPVDGVVVEGTGEVDESSMTGESLPVQKRPGSTVYAGTALGAGDLRVRVTAPPGAARIDGIVSMVEESSQLKAGVQSRAEHLADALVPYSLLAFFAILAITRRPQTAMAVLMVDYSCAIKLSMPIAVMSAMSEGTRRGVVAKGGRYLEELASVDTFVFDKTGTLTCACPTVERVFAVGGASEEDVLRLAACIEEHFPHSMARAIVDEAARRGLGHEDELHAKVNYVVAHGISTTVGGTDACIGSAHFVFEDEGVDCPAGFVESVAEKCPTASVIYLAIDHELLGALAISDPLRPEARATLDRLRELGVERFVMLTGDSDACARHVAARLGIDEWYSQVLPEDKSSYVQELRDQGHVVAMVGDGINDSPALAAADVSVAMSDASDIARAVADVCILNDQLSSLVTARELAQRLMGRIHADYRTIVTFNSALIALGVAGAISLTTASTAHNFSTFAIAAANARPLLPARTSRDACAPGTQGTRP